MVDAARHQWKMFIFSLSLQDKTSFSLFLNTELKGKDTHVRVSSAIYARADEGDELMTSLVDHEPADLTLVALLSETPKTLRRLVASLG